MPITHSLFEQYVRQDMTDYKKKSWFSVVLLAGWGVVELHLKCKSIILKCHWVHKSILIEIRYKYTDIYLMPIPIIFIDINVHTVRHVCASTHTLCSWCQVRGS